MTLFFEPSNVEKGAALVSDQGTVLLSNHRSRGAAMLLVLIAVAMATILALSFLASQGPTSVVASNIDRKAKARAIAESALKMAIDYVNEDTDWRTDKSSGTWMTDASLDGGTFTLTGIDADGDLADDDTDEVTLSVVATYEGVTHRVSARMVVESYPPIPIELTFVVRNDSALTSEESTKRDLFEDWGYTVTLLDDGADQSTFDAAVDATECVFISSEASYGSVGSKLLTHSIGVVYELAYMSYYFDIATSGTQPSGTAVEIVDNSHYVTEPFAVGQLEVATSSISLHANQTNVASGATRLGQTVGSTNYAILAVEVGADLLNSNTAPGRRVKLPWSGSTAQLNSNGRLLTRRALEWASNNTGESAPQLIALYEFEPVTIAPTLAGRWALDETGAGTGATVLVNDKLRTYNGAVIDAYDSASGAYGGANQHLSARVITNSTSSDDIELNNTSTIYGNVSVGTGGTPSTVIELNSGSTITGSTGAQSANTSITNYGTPSGSFGSYLGNQTYSGAGDSETWSSNKYFNDLTINSSATITISGDVEVHVADDLRMNGGHIVLSAGATLTIWVDDYIDIAGGSTINNDTTRPGDLQFLHYGSNNAYLDNSTIVGAFHFARDLSIDNNGQVYGALTAGDDIWLNDGDIHADLSTSPADSAASGPTTAADSSILANDGAINGGPAAGVAGQHGTAFEFDGSDDYVEIPHDDSYLMQGGTFSVWFNTDTTSPSRQGLFSKDSSGYDTGGHFSVFLRGSYVEVRMQSTTSSYYVRSSSGSIVAGNWYHIMFAWGEEGMVLYLNGVEVDTDSYTGGLGTTSGGVGNYEPIVLGSNSWTSGNLVATPLVDYFDGTLDDLRIYNERLSESQALEIYNGATEPSPFVSEVIVEDTSGFGDPLDLVIEDGDSVTWSGGGVTFDSDTLAVSLAEATKLYDAIDETGEFSVEVLLQRATPGTTASPSRIVAYSEGAGDSNFMLGQDSANYEARVRDSSTGNTGALSPEFVSTTSLNASGDTHVILSYKEGEVSVYIDGVLDETNTAGGTISNWENDMYLVLGGAFGGSSYWRGTLKRVAIYDRAFNATQASNVSGGSDPGDGSSGSSSSSVIWDEAD